MDSKSQEIIQEAKSEPVLIRICQVLESKLVDFNQILKKKMPGEQSLRKKNQILKKVILVTTLQFKTSSMTWKNEC